MALAATVVTGTSTVFGNKRVKVADLAFSGTYPTGGEVLSPSDIGLSAIDQVLPHGAAAEADLTGAWITKTDYQTNGTVKIALFESAGAGVVPTQKPNEAYESAGELRVTVIGH